MSQFKKKKIEKEGRVKKWRRMANIDNLVKRTMELPSTIPATLTPPPLPPHPGLYHLAVKCPVQRMRKGDRKTRKCWAFGACVMFLVCLPYSNVAWDRDWKTDGVPNLANSLFQAWHFAGYSQLNCSFILCGCFYGAQAEVSTALIPVGVLWINTAPWSTHI